MIDDAIFNNRGLFGDEETTADIGVHSPVVIQ